MPDYGWNEAPWLKNDDAKAATKLVIQSDITYIGNKAFAELNITSAEIPSSVTNIGDFSFYQCEKLSSITPLTNVVSIGESAFKQCKALSSLETGNSITSIGNEAFSACSSLSSIKLGNSLNSIGANAFYNCTSLSSIVITAVTVGQNAFYFCKSLSKVFFEERITTIGNNAFYGSGIKNLYYKGSGEEWKNVSGYNQSPLNSASKKYNFDPEKVDSVTLDKAYFYLGKGNTGTLTAVIFPETAVNKNVTWEVSEGNTRVEITDTEVTKSGSRATLKGLENGEATVTVKTEDGEKTAECVIEIGTPVKKVSFSEKKIDMGVGQTRQLEWTIEPLDAGNTNVSFRSDDDSIATVDDEGLVTGKSKGKTKVTVTTEDGDKKATIDVNVVEYVDVQNLYLDREKLLLAPGETGELTVEVTPSNATDKEVVWTVDRTSIATVKAVSATKAEITGVSEGTTTLTVTPKNKTGYYSPSVTCQITVWKGKVSLIKDNAPVESVILGMDSWNTSEYLSVDIPEDFSFDSQKWKVSDNSIATVDNYGWLRGVSEGETTVTFTGMLSGTAYEASCSVKVWKGSVSFKENTITVKKGIPEELKLEDIPEFVPVTGTTFEVLDTSIATVDKDGILTGIGYGETRVTVNKVILGNTYTAYCNVKVERSKYGDNPLIAIAGAKLDVGAILNPKGLYSGKIKYVTSNKRIAKANKKGILTPKNAGTVKVELLQNNVSVSSCEITVEKPVMTKKVSLYEGAYGINAFDYMKGTDIAPTEWISSKTKVAQVDPNTGEIWIYKKGSAKIIAVYGTGKNSTKKKYKFTIKAKKAN